MKKTFRTSMKRVHPIGKNPAKVNGQFVIYWMTENRRLHSNHALDRAIRWSRRLRQPLLVVESLSVNKNSTARRHRFLLDGMASNYVNSIEMGFNYVAFVERNEGESENLLTDLSSHAGAIICDFPKSKDKLSVLYGNVIAFDRKVETVDAAGLFPLPDSLKKMALSRRQDDLNTMLNGISALEEDERPDPNPIQHSRPAAFSLPDDISDKWAFSSYEDLIGPLEESLPINQSIKPIALAGGEMAGMIQLKKRLQNITIGTRFPNAMRNLQFSLMPYLRHGHLSPYDVMDHLEFMQEKLPVRFARIGRRLAHAFLTSHEIGLNVEFYQRTLPGYTTHIPPFLLRRLERQPKGKSKVDWQSALIGNTDDERWNSAQGMLASKGKIPDAMQRYWIGRIFEWSDNWIEAISSIEDALQRYSLLHGKGCVASLVGIMLGSFYEMHAETETIHLNPQYGFRMARPTDQEPAA